MAERELVDIDFIENKIDWEGWPDALEWLVSYDFGDIELNQMIYDATQLWTQLNYFHGQITDRVEELRNKDE